MGWLKFGTRIKVLAIIIKQIWEKQESIRDSDFVKDSFSRGHTSIQWKTKKEKWTKKKVRKSGWGWNQMLHV